jgi:hypothetical protein
MSRDLPAISPPVQASASNKPQIPYKKIAKITGAALFALGLLAIGFLAVFSNTYGIAGKLGVLSKLTLPGGAVLMAAGAISLIGVGILIYRACRSGKKPNQESPQPLGETIGSLSHLENRKTEPPPESDSQSTISSKNDPILVSSISRYEPSHSTSSQTNGNANGIGNQSNPIIPVEKKPINESDIPIDACPQISEEMDIQNVKIKDLLKLLEDEKNNIYQRLIGRSKQAQIIDLLPWTSSKSLKTLTLGEFRKFQFPAEVINDFASNTTKEANAFSLLSVQQIIPLLQENVLLPAQTLESIFVIDGGKDLRDYSKSRLIFLATYKPELLTKHFDTFPPKLLLLLPAGSMTNFPRKRLDYENIVQDLLPGIKQENPLSIYLLKQLDVSIIQYIARYLPVEAVAYFVEHQYEAPDFPWKEFMQKERFGLQFQRKHTKALALHLPWQEFVQNTREMEHLFNTNLEQRNEILKDLMCSSIRIVAPALDSICLGFVNCLDYFTDSQLSDPKFPWDIFINQRFLGFRIAKRWSLKLEHFLWEELAKQNNWEFEYALPIDNELQRQRAREILDKINVSLLKELVQSNNLSQSHVDLLSEDKRKRINENIAESSSSHASHLASREPLISTRHTKPMTYKNIFMMVAQEMGIKNIEEHLLKIYGKTFNPNTVQVQPEEIEAYKIKARLTLLPDEEILAFKIEALRELTEKHFAVLARRLKMMEKKQTVNSIAPGTSTKNLQTLSIGAFRSCQFTVEEVKTFNNSKLLVLLSEPQVMNLLKNEVLSEQLLKEIFPIDNRLLVINYTQKTLEDLGTKAWDQLSPHLKNMQPEHLRLLPFTRMNEEIFPWSKINNAEGLPKFLTGIQSGFGNTRTENILRNLKMSIIQQLSPNLPAESIRFFSKEQLTEQGFPWPTFIQKQGIGARLHTLDVEVFEHIPWQEFAKTNDRGDYIRDEELANLLPPETEKTKEILQKLDCNSIQTLVPIVNSYYFLIPYLAYFTNQQLEEREFPWTLFITALNIGTELAIRPKEALKHFPWEELAEHCLSDIEKMEEIQKALPLYTAKLKKRALDILENMGDDLITNLHKSGCLSDEYIKLLSENKQ